MITHRKTADETLVLEHLWDSHVTASAWSVDAGATVEALDSKNYLSRAKVSGGTLGTTYKVTNDVALDTGEILERSALVQVVVK